MTKWRSKNLTPDYLSFTLCTTVHQLTTFIIVWFSTVVVCTILLILQHRLQ